MSHETLTSVPLNPDTAEQHDVVHGEVVEPATDEHGFMESALRSQNGETHPESRKPRHKREVVESIDPENIKLYGMTATLAQMQSARELVHSEEFLAHTPEEQEYLIENILERMLIEDDPLHESYASKKRHLRAILLESDKKFKKTARRKELDQARRDGVKLQRRGKHEKVVELDNDQSDVEQDVTPISVRKLKREIKKLDQEYLGIVGEIAETGTKPKYLEAKYAELKAMTSPDNYEINGRNRRSAEREVIRKLVQPAVEAKNLEGEERQAYEDHLVAVFHDYASLSDEDREGLHESLGERYHKGKELRELNRTSATEDTEHTSFTEKVKNRLSSRLGGRAVAAAFKRRWDERRSATENRESHEDETDGQLALFSDEPYKTSEKSRLKRSADWLKDGAWAMIEHNKARRVHKQHLEQMRLETLSDEERALEREKKRDLKTSLLVMLGGAAVLAVSIYYMKNGLDNPLNGISKSGNGGIKNDGLADLLNPPSNQDVVPGVELDSRGGGDGNSYSQSAFRVDNGEGLFQTFQDMGIPHDEWHDVLHESGPKLVRMGDAYSDPSLGGYGLNGDGKLSRRALDVISEAAKNAK